MKLPTIWPSHMEARVQAPVTTAIRRLDETGTLIRPRPYAMPTATLSPLLEIARKRMGNNSNFVMRNPSREPIAPFARSSHGWFRRQTHPLLEPEAGAKHPLAFARDLPYGIRVADVR